jgi:hypothetical protein
MFKHFYKFYVNAIIKKLFFSLKSIGFKRTVIKLILKIKKKKFEIMLFKINYVQEKIKLALYNCFSAFYLLDLVYI